MWITYTLCIIRTILFNIIDNLLNNYNNNKFHNNHLDKILIIYNNILLYRSRIDLFNTFSC